MSISVTCACGRHFETPEANAGRRAQCPTCGRIWIVPKPEPVPEVMVLAAEPEEVRTSSKAVASLWLGALFFFACLSGLPAIALGVGALRDIGRSGGRLRGRRRAVAGIVLGGVGCLLTVALSFEAYRSAREAGRRALCIGNLGQIGLAVHNYHSVYDCLPPAAITDRNGRPLLSWRVALTPFVDASPLYAKFHLDEPWNSPHNLTLLDQMPSYYACPSDASRKPGMTGYQAVIGPATAFPPDFKPVTFDDITDGTSNTLLVGESRRLVPWTKPEDLPFDIPLPLHGFGSHHGYHNNGWNALMTDGSVHFVQAPVDPKHLGSLLTRNRGERGNPDNY